MKETDAIVELAARLEARKFLDFKPYGHPDTFCPDGALWKEKHAAGEWSEWSNKPWQREFYAAGASKPQRMLMCANQVGKTTTAAPEVVFHLTGQYPKWWEGYRFDRPILAWVCGVNNETCRDVLQDKLIGQLTQAGWPNGDGLLTPRMLTEKPSKRMAGISDVVDTIRVKHASGGVSTLQIKSYDQGKRAFMGRAIDLAWLDEEPDEGNMKQDGIFAEVITRLVSKRGILLVTFTPLLGETKLVRHFMQTGREQKIDTVGVYSGTWDDAPHLTPEKRNEIILSYPEHERETRTRGVPMIGTGRVFLVPEDSIKVDPFSIPQHFFQICGIDFGFHTDHPGTGAWLAIDRDRDIWYVTDCYAQTHQTPVYHASAINARGSWIPVSWPHDGMNAGKADGVPLKDHFVRQGVNMLPVPAHYAPEGGGKPVLGGQPVEPIVMDINERCKTGRFRVFSHLHQFFDEYRNLHRDDRGKIVAYRDDVLKAVFYAGMMQRYAMQQTATGVRRRSSRAAMQR